MSPCFSNIYIKSYTQGLIMDTGYIQEMIFMDFKIGVMIPTIKTTLLMDTLDMISV